MSSSKTRYVKKTSHQDFRVIFQRKHKLNLSLGIHIRYKDLRYGLKLSDLNLIT